MLKISDFDFTDKRAIVRVDFNVPLNEDMQITDDTRITAALPTIKKITETGSAILMSHLGRPKAKEDKFSLRHIVSHLSELTGKNVKFVDDCIGKKVKQEAENLKNGEILLLENLRYHPEETKGDEDFAKQLSELADVYVNDAFGTAHRAHASTTIIADYFPENKMFGYVIEGELESLSKVVGNPKKPLTAIIGGAKVSSKISIIEKMLEKVDNLIIGGGMTFTFIKAQGGKIGNSLFEEDFVETAKQVMKTAEEKGVKLYLPVDSINADAFSPDANKSYSDANDISDGLMGLDVGEKTIKMFSDIIENSGSVLWNGPVGVFEFERFANGTIHIANALVNATENGAYTLVGGGDSVAAIKKYELGDKVSYVSTGGGAMLEFIEGKELPGIAAIRK